MDNFVSHFKNRVASLFGSGSRHPTALAIPSPDTNPHIVLVRTDRIGDHLLFFGFIPPLRAAFPRARITLACPKDVSSLLPYRPLLDEVVEFEREQGHQDAAYRREIVSTIERVPVDLLICPQYSRDNLANKLSTMVSTSCRIGFASESNLDHPSHVRKHKKYARQFHLLVPVSNREISELEKYRQLLRALKIHEPLAMPFFQPPDVELAGADALLAREGLAGHRLISIFPGAANALRSVSQIGTAIRENVELAGFALVGLGDKNHKDLIEKTIKDSGLKGASVAGLTTLPAAAAIMKRCDLAVGADTGLAHLACAVGIKNVILLGGGDFGRFLPYSPLTTTVALPLACYYCHFDCHQPEPYCLSAIPASTVRAAISHALANKNVRPQLFVPGDDASLNRLKTLRVQPDSLRQKIEGSSWDVHEV